ncbi:MAG: transcriptional regulator FnrL [Paracoccaceae bacterium]
MDPRLTPHLRCRDCPIRHRAICSRCGSEELKKLDALKFYRTYSPGDHIAWAGEKLEFLGSVVKGYAAVSRTIPDGRRQMVGLLLPSDFVGRPGRESTRYDVVASTEITLCMFRKTEFERLVAETPSLERRLLEMTLDELDVAREWMLLLGRKTAREKIASLLAILARRSAALGLRDPDDGLGFELPFTRETMADYLGLTIETVSRQLTSLRKDGIVAMKDAHYFAIPDYTLLLDEAGEDSDGGIFS